MVPRLTVVGPPSGARKDDGTAHADDGRKPPTVGATALWKLELGTNLEHVAIYQITVLP
jgi:hypothetical protein